MTDEFADTFVEEGREQLTDIENNLIDLEDDPEDDEAMNQIFRSAHTLKGNAGAMGFEKFSDLAHAAEDLLDEIRAGNVTVTSEVIDHLFDTSDVMREMLKEVAEDGETKTDPEEEIEALHKVLDQASSGDDGSDDAEADELGQCDALTDDGDRCERDANDEEDRYCTQHRKKVEEEGPEAVTDFYDVEDNGHDDVEALLEEVDAPDEQRPNAYHVVLTVSADSDSNGRVIEAIGDAFDVRGAIPPVERVREDYDGSFGVVLAGNIESDDEIVNWFGDMEGVEDISATEITDRVDWADDEDEVISEGLTEDADDDVEEDVEIESIDDLDSLVGTGEFDEVEDVDEDSVDDVDLGIDEMEDSGTFDSATVKQEEDEEADESEADDEEEVPDNRGARIFNELEDEVDQTDDFGEIEEEMEEMGFNEDFDEMDEDEVGFDELIDSDPDDDFEFDGEADDDFSDELDSAAQESAPELFGDDAEEAPDESSDEEEEESVEIDTDTGVEIESEDDIDNLLEEGDASTDDPFADSSPDQQFDEDESTEEADAEESTDPETVPGVGEIDTGSDDGDLFDSEFDEGGVEFDDLLEEAGRGGTDDSGESIDSIRVDVDQLDELYSLVQELVTSRIRLRRAITDGASGETMGQAFDELDTLETITSRMQDTVMDIRLVRLDRATEKLPRVVRNTARDNGKDVDFEISGEDVELDRAILEQLGDPLMHIVRNAVDHGIEDPDTREANGKPRKGTLELSARRTRDRVTIKIEDDGGGINPDEVRSKAVDEGILTEEQASELGDSQALELIFHPGFSTNDEVSETSGRGVGLDVVYTTIRSLDGSVDVSSTPGKGTTFRLRLPVSLAIDEVLLIESGGEEYGIPIKNISEISGVTDVERVNGQLSHVKDDEVYPVIRLSETLDTGGDAELDDGRLIRIDKGVRQVVVHCDNVVKSSEVVVEPYDGVLRTVPGLSGAAVLGEGDVVNILDVERL